jgi:hypothetical protein
MENEELMRCLMDHGRWIPQDFVTRSHNVKDVIYYLRAEFEFEILKLTSFVTTNLVNFERIKTSRFIYDPSPRNNSMGDTVPVDTLD